MNLTLFDLTNLQRHCDSLSSLIKDIKSYYNQYNDESVLFASRSDYEASMKIKDKMPQDFYVFRHFDVFFQLVYHKGKKEYHLIAKGFYSHHLNPFHRYNDSKDRYVVGKDFESALAVFRLLVSDYIKEMNNELF